MIAVYNKYLRSLLCLLLVHPSLESLPIITVLDVFEEYPAKIISLLPECNSIKSPVVVVTIIWALTATVHSWRYFDFEFGVVGFWFGVGKGRILWGGHVGNNFRKWECITQWEVRKGHILITAGETSIVSCACKAGGTLWAHHIRLIPMIHNVNLLFLVWHVTSSCRHV